MYSFKGKRDHLLEGEPVNYRPKSFFFFSFLSFFSFFLVFLFLIFKHAKGRQLRVLIARVVVLNHDVIFSAL